MLRYEVWHELGDADVVDEVGVVLGQQVAQLLLALVRVHAAPRALTSRRNCHAIQSYLTFDIILIAKFNLN